MQLVIVIELEDSVQYYCRFKSDIENGLGKAEHLQHLLELHDDLTADTVTHIMATA